MFGRDAELERALRARVSLERCTDPRQADLLWALTPDDLGWRTFGLDRRDLLDAGLPIPPTRLGVAGEVLEKPMYARSLRVGGPSRRIHGVLSEDCLLQPILPSALAEGEVTLLFVDGDLAQATRAIPVRKGAPVVQPLGLFQGEDRVGREVLAEIRLRFDAELGRRAPLFLRVDLLRLGSEPVVSDVRMCGPAFLQPSTADALAAALVEARKGSESL